MSDTLSKEDRALIDAHLREKGATKCAPGESWHPGFVWVPKKGLVSKDPQKTDPKLQSKRRGSPRSPEVAARRQRLREHAIAGGFARDFAEQEGISPEIVYRDAKLAGITLPRDPKTSFTSEEHQTRLRDRRAKVVELRAQGFTLPQVAEAVGVSRSTVQKALKVLAEQTKGSE